MKKTIGSLLVWMLLLAGCAAEGPAEEAASAGVVPGEEAVAARVAAAHARLDTSAAGRLAREAIDAHGGLTRWYANGPLYFRFNYRPLGRRGVDTYQLVDTWSSRARHWLAEDSTIGFGWDGATAWRTPPGAELPTNARFWALTPYYFIAIPFVLGDAGVVLADGGTMTFEDRLYDLIDMRFEAGTGDAPDDYYLVLIDRETRRVGGVRYVVSYPGYYPDGGHSPEKLITYDGAQQIDGITFPETFRSFAWTEDGPGALVTETTLSDIAFRPATPDSAFALPPGAEALEGY